MCFKGNGRNCVCKQLSLLRHIAYIRYMYVRTSIVGIYTCYTKGQLDYCDSPLVGDNRSKGREEKEGERGLP